MDADVRVLAVRLHRSSIVSAGGVTRCPSQSTTDPFTLFAIYTVCDGAVLFLLTHRYWWFLGCLRPPTVSNRRVLYRSGRRLFRRIPLLILRAVSDVYPLINGILLKIPLLGIYI